MLASLGVPRWIRYELVYLGTGTLNEHFSALWWTYWRHLDSKPLVLLPRLDGFDRCSGSKNESFEKAAFFPYGHTMGTNLTALFGLYCRLSICYV